MASNTLNYLPADADPRSVYIHIPFCRHRCGYCNFALVAGRDHLIEPFLDALEKEIHQLSHSYTIDTLFLGGGTPSHLSSGQLNRLAAIIESRFQLSSDAEVSAECNPSDISPNTLSSLSSLGVNRISLGVQSFSSTKLKVLQRDHNGERAKQAFADAMKRFGNVSMDMIFAAPDETPEEWDEDLRTAISLGPSHLSTYELTWEKGTTFWNRRRRGELDASGEETGAVMYESAIQICEDAGLQQYEVSSFAISGKQCRHNLQYWFCNPWFAFGPGAASFTDGERNTNHRSPTTWTKRIQEGHSPIQEREPLSPKERAIERLIFGLRMVAGVNIHEFELAVEQKLEYLAGPAIEQLTNQGLLEEKKGMLRLTHSGRMVADSVAVELL